MQQQSEEQMAELAPDAPRPFVRYIDKTRAYYKSQGYEKPYVWAQNDGAPFTALAKPLSASTITLISTSEIAIKGDPRFDDNPETRAQGNVYAVPSNTPASKLYSRTQSYDRYATSLDDPNAYFPIDRLHEAATRGRIGKVATDYLGVYNAYSQRKTIERDAPEVLAMCRAMAVDVALLVPV
jgi:D-proline reductase (dithiol) PrdB